jgi:hypothetical protein
MWLSSFLTKLELAVKVEGFLPMKCPILQCPEKSAFTTWPVGEAWTVLGLALAQ